MILAVDKEANQLAKALPATMNKHKSTPITSPMNGHLSLTKTVENAILEEGFSDSDEEEQKSSSHSNKLLASSHSSARDGFSAAAKNCVREAKENNAGSNPNLLQLPTS